MSLRPSPVRTEAPAAKLGISLPAAPSLGSSSLRSGSGRGRGQGSGQESRASFLLLLMPAPPSLSLRRDWSQTWPADGEKHFLRLFVGSFPESLGGPEAQARRPLSQE